MRKLAVFMFFLCSASMLVNLYPAFSGFGDHPFDSISLISSTIAWFCHLFIIYFIGWKPNYRPSLKYISILLLATIFFSLYDVFLKLPENIELASGGLLAGMYVFMNYTSRISLLVFAVGVLWKKELLLRIAMMTLAVLIFISFSVTSYELVALYFRTETSGLFTLASKILDPFAILSTFLLQLNVLVSRKLVVEALKKNYAEHIPEGKR